MTTRNVVKAAGLVTSGAPPPPWLAAPAYLPQEGRMLDYGSWQGIVALLMMKSGFTGAVEYAHSSSGRVAAATLTAKANGLLLAPKALFPLAGSWRAILLAAPAQTEALAMLASQAADSLTANGVLVVVDAGFRPAALAGAYAKVALKAKGDGWTLTCCSEPYSCQQPLPWLKTTFTVKGLQLTLESLPGNFSPGALDLGSRTLLETATIPKGGRVLDLACGYGALGITAAMQGAGEVVYADDCLIALTAVRRNLEALGLEGEAVHCHLPEQIPGKFACILCNPPFHSDYSVAKSFIEFARRRLELEGWLYLVVKKPDWYRRKLASCFGGSITTEKNGYHVLAAQQRFFSKPALKEKTTRKHRRRQGVAVARRGSDGGH